jgi:hypothetical protein
VSALQLDLKRSWADDDAWQRRLRSDGLALASLVPNRLWSVHAAVVTRAGAGNANGLILSGSTARRRRTAISDLDYHVIGPAIDREDLPYELDLHVLSREKLHADIMAGDDFVQWSLRFGRIVFDDGSLREALRLIDEARPWPDASRKRANALKSLNLTERIVETGDHDAAVVQVRTSLSLAARALLLGREVFPMSRAELPQQLADVGEGAAGEALQASIDGSPSLDELAAAVVIGRRLIDADSAELLP